MKAPRCGMNGPVLAGRARDGSAAPAHTDPCTGSFSTSLDTSDTTGTQRAPQHCGSMPSSLNLLIHLMSQWVFPYYLCLREGSDCCAFHCKGYKVCIYGSCVPGITPDVTDFLMGDRDRSVGNQCCGSFSPDPERPTNSSKIRWDGSPGTDAAFPQALS